MTYSSSKASVVAAAAEAGVTFDHMVRVVACIAHPAHYTCCQHPIVALSVFRVKADALIIQYISYNNK